MKVDASSRARLGLGARAQSVRGPLSRAEVRSGSLLVIDVPRPRTRAECPPPGSPCIWVGCKFHAGIEVKGKALKLVFPDRDVDEIPEPCVLRVADRGPIFAAEIGPLLNCTEPRIDQVRSTGIAKIAAALDLTEDEAVLALRTLGAVHHAERTTGTEEGPMARDDADTDENAAEPTPARPRPNPPRPAPDHPWRGRRANYIAAAAKREAAPVRKRPHPPNCDCEWHKSRREAKAAGKTRDWRSGATTTPPRQRRSRKSTPPRPGSPPTGDRLVASRVRRLAAMLAPGDLATVIAWLEGGATVGTFAAALDRIAGG